MGDEHQIVAVATVEELREYGKHPNKDRLEMKAVRGASVKKRKMYRCVCGAGKFRKDETALAHLREVGEI